MNRNVQLEILLCKLIFIIESLIDLADSQSKSEISNVLNKSRSDISSIIGGNTDCD